MIDKTRLKSRPANAADVLAFFGKSSPHSIKARVIEHDGAVVGIAGYYISGGKAVMFSDNKQDVPAMTIWREATALMSSVNIPAICFGSGKSRRFLERLGWKFSGQTKRGLMFLWDVPDGVKDE